MIVYLFKRFLLLLLLNTVNMGAKMSNVAQLLFISVSFLINLLK